MLIEELIRLGRPLLEDESDPRQVLRLISGVEDERVKNFFRHVFVIEWAKEGGEPRALPVQAFGEPDEDGDFEVNQGQALGIPFVIPSGGNPLNPQGCYGLPVYPCYHAHVQAFRESAEGVLDFLRGRLERTPGFHLTEETLQLLAQALHSRLAAENFGGEKKILGVLVLARHGAGEFYELAAAGREDRIGLTADGRSIVPQSGRIADAAWAAKVEEGREAGSRTGTCSFSGAEGELVSAYCKAWPWAFPTWTCPLPHGGDETMLVEGIAMTPEVYRALTLGACVFNKLARRVSSLVIPEIFSPADTRAGKEQAQRRKLSDLPAVLGSGFVLPVQDATLADPEHRTEFCRGVRGMLDADPSDPTLADRYLSTVTGFDFILPPEMDQSDYRVTLVYFSGDYTRGDVQLRAFIQDVIPSTMRRLRDLAREEATVALSLLRLLLPKMSEKQQGYYARCYPSVPYLLARAYGGAYLWQQLEAVLHGRPLESRRVTANAARRMQSLVPRWPETRFALIDEVALYLHFLRFLARANRELANREEEAMPIQDWQQLLTRVEKGPVSNLKLDDVAELGFACGALVRRFSRSYYMARKAAKPDADFVRDRVLTFGSDLRPDAVHDKGLRMILELPNRLKELRRSRDLEERVGVAIVAFQRLREQNQIDKRKDDFITAFWAGYALQGHDRPKSKPRTKQPAAQAQE
jgi:hypothetical protein